MNIIFRKDLNVCGRKVINQFLQPPTNPIKFEINNR